MKLRKCIFFFLTFFCLFNFSACTNSAETAPIEMESSITQKGEFSAWLAYWDMENGVKELSKVSDKISSISSFALYFKNDGSISADDNMLKGYSSISEITSKNDINLYVCAVNDVIDEKGEIVQKDTNIIRKLLSTQDERNRHINDLVSYAVNNGYFGIEIDYEKLEDDVWQNFVVFCGELYNKCVENKLDLRVILEPKAPIDRYKLPDGPEYIMMAYNLYGLSTEPGPKADIAFIKELAEKMNTISGKKWFALATGGFDWKTNGETQNITESKALDIINIYNCLPTRDEASGCLYFYYTDENGNDHTVWYADNVTLNTWIQTAKECGYSNICLWKFGGNSSITLEQLKDNFDK